MFTTAQFRVFAGEPDDRILSRPRHLLRDGDRTQAEAAYLDVIENEPHLKAAWGEYFQLLRAEGRLDDALQLADRAVQHFEGDAFSGALKGAALVEMGRLRQALQYLQASADQDPDFGMVWHEMGYAAYRLGEPAHALLALDRAFALDPRSGTLHLRGKILRNSGQYVAAEVAFAGAAEAAEFPEQHAEAERQIATTRRFASLGRRPSELSPHERWFAEQGAALLTVEQGEPTMDSAILDGLVELVRRQQWEFTVVVALDGGQEWSELAGVLRLPCETSLEPGFGLVPLVVARQPEGRSIAWQKAAAAIANIGSGLTFVLEQSVEQPAADIAGRLGGVSGGSLNLDQASGAASHPEGRLAGRRLR
jgi:Flp pilus assembly protein TadD